MGLCRRKTFILALIPTTLSLVCLHLLFRRQLLIRLSKMSALSITTTERYVNDATTLPNAEKITIKTFYKPQNSTEKKKAIIECPEESPLLKGRLGVSVEQQQNAVGNWPPTFEEIAVNNPDLELGGYYLGPKNCIARNTVAVIVPFRDREEHLRFFLHYIHLILQRQQTRYIIYIVEQDNDKTFNKGQLMNTGFLYAVNTSDVKFDCFFFHDVDTISEDDRTMYKCRGGGEVVHLAKRIDRYNYKLCCGVTVGGVVGFTKQQYLKINGFSNMFYGWGGEDDDMNARIKSIGKMTVYRPPQEFKRFKVISHQRDENNPSNPMRFKLLNNWLERQPQDGINTLAARISNIVKYKTHTRIYVAVKPQT